MGWRREPSALQEFRSARVRTGPGWTAHGSRADSRAREGAGLQYEASQRGTGAEYRAGVGWRRSGPALGGNWCPSNRRSHAPMERRMGVAALGAEPSLWRMGSVWLAGCPYLLGLGSWERGL